MADQHAGFQMPVFHAVRPRLAEHLQNGGAGPLEVVRRGGVPLRRLRQGVFQVRQVHLRPSLQQTQGLRLFIPAGVPHHWHRPGLLSQSLQNGGSEVGGGHQVQAGRSLADELPEDLPQALNCQGLSRAPLGDGGVLAEDAPEIAAGEEHRSGPALPGKAGFLPPVKHGPGRHGEGGHGAHAAGEGLRALRAAVPGAEGADHGDASSSVCPLASRK